MDVKKGRFKEVQQRSILPLVERYLCNHGIFMPLLPPNIIIVHLEGPHDPRVLPEPLVARLVISEVLRDMLGNYQSVLIFLNYEGLDHGPLVL